MALLHLNQYNPAARVQVAPRAFSFLSATHLRPPHMPPQVRTGVLRPCPDWNDESDLTDLTDSEVEEEVQEQAPQRKQGPPPPPPEDKGDESPSSRPRPGRTTRQATQKLADEDMGAVNDHDQRALPEYKHTPTKVDDVYGKFFFSPST